MYLFSKVRSDVVKGLFNVECAQSTPVLVENMSVTTQFRSSVFVFARTIMERKGIHKRTIRSESSNTDLHHTSVDHSKTAVDSMSHLVALLAISDM